MFPELLLQLENGATIAELGDRLRDLVCAVRDTGKTGTITLAIKITPATEMADVVTIVADIKTKLPAPTRAKNIFFSTEEGNLSRHDPKQMELPMQPAPRMQLLNAQGDKVYA